MYRLIACNIFQREACYCLARAPHAIDVTFLEVGMHAQPESLREAIQAEIDATERSGKPYEAVLLLYGLCGNAATGLRARSVPLVIPRAHDCCTVLLGGREAFLEHFGDNPSRPFTSTGYLERGEYFLRKEDGVTTLHYGDGYAELVEQYGAEDARYIWETMHPVAADGSMPPAAYIEIAETAGLGHFERFRASAGEEGLEWERLEGSLAMIRQLLHGEWPEERYLVVPPGAVTVGVYDWHEVILAVG